MKYASGSSVGERGQITIERSIRDRLGIRPKDVAIQRIDKGRLVVEFIRPHEPHMRSLAGMLAPVTDEPSTKGPPVAPEDSIFDSTVGHAIAEEWRAYLASELPDRDPTEAAALAAVIYVDTSVVVRYLTWDDPERSPGAAAVIETDEARAVSIVTILESAHVLRSAYGHERRNVAAALIALIERRNIVVPEFDEAHVLRWLDAWRDGLAESIGDALIAASMSAARADAIVTFDRGFPAGEWVVLSGPSS